LRELVPRLAARARRAQAFAAKVLEHERVELSRRMASGAVGLEPALAQVVQRRFGEDAARGIAGAEEKDVERLGHKGFTARTKALTNLPSTSRAADSASISL